MKIINPQLSGSVYASGSFVLPSGRANQRPSNPVSGSLFFEISDSGSVLTVYNGSGSGGWEIVGKQTTPVAASVGSTDLEYLLVAGGASGGSNGGGGGAGGYLSSSLSSVTSGSSFTITVGAGGTNSVSYQAKGNAGTDSSIAGASISTITSTGGGGGGSNNLRDGDNGGSGGGAGVGASATGTGGSGTVGQGKDGGSTTTTGHPYVGAGGGGAGVAGSNGGGSSPGDGGDGLQSPINGTLTYYAGGGGGTGGTGVGYTGPGGSGGQGGGGAGGVYNGNGTNATANTGGGGGASGDATTVGAGGSGVAIFAYDSASFSGLGGIKSSRADGYVVHTFNESGTLTIGGPNDNPIIPQNNFNALVYTGDHTYPRNIDVGFKPDLVWIKNNGTGHHWRWFDIVRGIAPLYPNNTSAEDNYNDGPEVIVNGHSNGFTIINNPDGTNSIGAGVNENTKEIAAYCWKGGITGSNSAGNITSTVSANPDIGFSAVGYTGNLSSATTATAQSVGHGLNQAPEIIFFLNRAGATHRVAGTFGSNWSDLLPLPGAAAAKTDYYATYPMAAPTDSVFYTNYISAINVNANNHIAYCFHSVPGFSKIGTYTGTAGPNNQIDVGFKPKMVIIKSLAAQDWNVFDSARETGNPKNYALKLNSSATEATEAAFVINFNSTGFELDGTGGAGGEGQINASSSTYLYMAFAE